MELTSDRKPCSFLSEEPLVTQKKLRLRCPRVLYNISTYLVRLRVISIASHEHCAVGMHDRNRYAHSSRMPYARSNVRQQTGSVDLCGGHPIPRGPTNGPRPSHAAALGDPGENLAIGGLRQLAFRRSNV